MGKSISHKIVRQPIKKNNDENEKAEGSLEKKKLNNLLKPKLTSQSIKKQSKEKEQKLNDLDELK